MNVYLAGLKRYPFIIYEILDRIFFPFKIPYIRRKIEILKMTIFCLSLQVSDAFQPQKHAELKIIPSYFAVEKIFIDSWHEIWVKFCVKIGTLIMAEVKLGSVTITTISCLSLHVSDAFNAWKHAGIRIIRPYCRVEKISIDY